jgi:hypothetical protein
MCVCVSLLRMNAFTKHMRFTCCVWLILARQLHKPMKAVHVICNLRVNENMRLRVRVCFISTQHLYIREHIRLLFLQFITNLTVITRYRQFRTDNGRTTTVHVSRMRMTKMKIHFRTANDFKPLPS